jgi:hypothetical protein
VVPRELTDHIRLMPRADLAAGDFDFCCHGPFASIT